MTKEARFKPSRKHLLLLALIALGIYVVLPQLGSFHSSWHLLGGAKAAPTVIAVILTFLTFAAAAGTYCLLAFRPLAYGRTLLVQLAAMFVNRLLPAGVGALGTNYLYLRKQRHSPAQAGTMVGVNNLLGFSGHGLIVVCALLLSSGRTVSSSSRGSDLLPVLLAIMGAAVLLLALGLFFGKKRFVRALSDVRKQLFSYRKRPLALAGAQCTSIILTLCNVSALFFCARAMGLELPFLDVLLVFTLGVGAGAAVPTPGGLGGFEAGLAAGFAAYGVEASPALAAALLYRLVSYWLPLLVGGLAFAVCQRRRLFEA
jgi:uncharacterized membrane protein YbhN (UPF0104 family)